MFRKHASEVSGSPIKGFNVGDFIDLILEKDQIIIRHTPEEESRQLIEARSKWKR